VYIKKFIELFKPTKKGSNREKEEIEHELFHSLNKFRENTKSLDYLRKELEDANKGKSDEEIMESLAKTFKDNTQKRA